MDMQDFCQREVEPMGKECEQVRHCSRWCTCILVVNIPGICIVNTAVIVYLVMQSGLV